MARQKLLFRLMPVEEIPRNLVLAFARATRSSDKSVLGVAGAKLKIGVFHNRQVVGFISGSWGREKILLVQGYFVQKKFRGNIIGSRLIRRMVLEARKLGLLGIDIEKMTMQTVYLFGREKKIAWAKKKNSLEFSTMSTRGGQFLGRIRFDAKPA